MKYLLILSLFLLLGIVSSQYNPMKDRKICGRPTCKGQQKFKYLQGNRYTYEYTTNTKTFSEDGVNANKSIISVKGEVSIVFITECDALMELSKFKFSDKELPEDLDYEDDNASTELFSEALSKNSLRFSFNDGVISEVCPDESEESWILNFKKGILSIIYNDMRRFDLDYTGVEEDIHGKCQASYKLQKARNSILVVEKSRDFSSCQGRSQLHSSLQSTPYYYKTKQHRANLLKSSSTCELAIDNRIYDNIKCKEVHIFQPFSSKTVDATTVVEQNLNFVTESKEEIAVDDLSLITRRQTLLFDHKTTARLSLDGLKTIRNLVQTLCKLNSQDVQTEYAETFSTLIRQSRTLNYGGLSSLLRHANIRCHNGKKFILDALPYLGSDAAIEVMKDVALRNEISDDILRSWIITTSFLPNPSTTMLRAMHEILKVKIDDSIIVLGISSLVHTYCVQNSNCLLKETPNDIVNLLEKRLTENIERKKKLRDLPPKEIEQQIFVTLKALGNIGEVSKPFRVYLDNIVEDLTLENGIRVAAIETYRRLPCNQARSFFEKLFENEEEDSEIRIASYLQVMRCPDYKTIQNIHNTLQKEQVNQVGSFVWSHLNNLLKSSILNRLEIQGLLSDKELKRKFSTDVRKFSRNFEGALFFEEFNFGGNYDSNVIFSPSSYIPRSIMLNMTIDLFGESINLFEVYGRIEGFERFVENLFGNNGDFSYENVKDKIPKVRWPRAISQSNVLTNEINDFDYKLKNNFNNPKFSTGFKIFGNDIRFETFSGEEEIKSSLKKFNILNYLKQILSGKEINISKSTLFMDTSYVVPTGSGFPLSLNILGTASFNLKMFGSLKVSNHADGKEFDLFGSIRPNMAVNIVGTMSVNGIYGVSGIKLKSNVYSSSSAEGSIKVKGNRLVSVKINLPQQTNEIFGAESQLFLIKGERDESFVTDDNNMVMKTTCSWPTIDKTVGLKLCAHIHFANNTKTKENSYFSLAGPAGVRISLHKSDTSIKTYSLEYSLKDIDDKREISIVFDTPGSLVERMISAHLISDSQTFNASLRIQSPSGQVYAEANFRNSKLFQYFQASLDIDDKKHFLASLSLEQQDSTHGVIFLPKFYLEVNAERVAELFGTFKRIEKNGVSQCDVDLKFQTKRLTSKLFGYITQMEHSIGTNLKLDYKFAQTQEQRVRLEYMIENRSTRFVYAYTGNLKFETTAYPQFNMDIDLKYQIGSHRMEGKLELKTNPPGDKTTDADFNRLSILAKVVERTHQDEMTFSTVFSVTKPASNLNLSFDLSYESKGPYRDIFSLIKYAEDKQVTVSVFWFRPRGTFEHMEGRINVTIPGFEPMLLEGKLNEKLQLDYDIELSGTWFSGHNFTSVGVYQDKSSSKTFNHRLKFLIKSQSFRDIHADCHFYRDNSQIEVNLQADQHLQEYAIFFKNSVSSNNLTLTQFRIRYQNRIYSVTSSLNLKEHEKQLMVELHLDEYRDIHFSVWGKNQDSFKSVSAGMEIKWDANRDPNQKLSFLLDFLNPQIYDYSANLILSYPGRSFNGVSHFFLQEGTFSVLFRLTWDTDKAIGVNLSTLYKDGNKRLLVQINSELVTPFEKWRRTSFDMGFNHGGNNTRLNGSVHWQSTHHVSIDLSTDYVLIDASSLNFKLVGSLNSTIKEIQSMIAKLDHRHNKTKVDTLIFIMYEPEKIIDIISIWQIAETTHMTNLTGSVSLTTPFYGYRKGILISKIHMTNDRNIRGVADLSLDHKKFTASVKGHLQKLTNSMINFNISTPNEKYKELRGQLGFLEEDKYLVALVQYPARSVGIEVRFSLTAITTFDVKFYLATPIEFLMEVLLVAKLKPETADFRAGWNQMLAGFTGKWHFQNITDFDHSYKLFTPIQDYESNGVVVKLMLKEGLDTEFSVKMAQYRLGVKVVGQQKPKLFKEMDIKFEDVYNLRKYYELSDSIEEYDQDGRPRFPEEIESMSWGGLVEIDALVYPTMRGTLDMDQLGNVYAFSGTLKLPDGQATLEDLFSFQRLLNMENQLHIITPFESFKDMNFDFKISVKSSKKYLASFDFRYQNRTDWTKAGALAKYTLEHQQPNKLTQHRLTGHVHTPFQRFPSFDLFTALDVKENVYRINVSAATNKSTIWGEINTEFDEGLLELEGGISVKSPIINVPPAHFFFKKESTLVENSLDFLFNTSLNETHKFVVETMLRYQSLINFKTDLKLQMPFQSMDKSQIGAYVLITNISTEAEIHLELSPVYLITNISLKDSILRSHVLLNFHRDKHNAVLLCLLRKTSSLTKDARGHLTLDGRIYNVNGLVQLLEDGVPTKIEIQIQPRSTGNPYLIEYLHNPKLQEYNFSVKRHQQEIVALQTLITDKNKFEKSIVVQIDTIHKKYKTFKIEATAISNSANSILEVKAETPFPQVERPAFGISFTNDVLGYRHMSAHFNLKESKGNLDCSWKWVVMENMIVKLVGNIERGNKSNDAFLEAFYVNPDKSGSLQIGALADINNVWKTFTNLTLRALSKKKLDFSSYLKLPPPQLDTHSLIGGYDSAFEAGNFQYHGNYKTSHTNKNYGSSGTITYGDKSKINGIVDVEWGKKHVKNLLAMGIKSDAMDFEYKLYSPYYDNEETVVANLTYNGFNDYHNFSFHAFSPASRQVGKAVVDFKSMKNMNGTLNVTSPFKGLTHIGSRFDFQSTRKVYNRYLEVFWPNHTAFIDSKCNTEKSVSPSANHTNGVILVVVPLSTKHVARVDYSYKEQAKISTGTATVIYNNSKIIDGKYNCVSESKKGSDKDRINIELKNKWLPLGLIFIRGYQTFNDKLTKESKRIDKNSKRIEIYHLYNKTGFNVTGDLVVLNTESGQNISIMAINLNRTVKFWTDYDIRDQKFKQHSKLELEPTVWIGYNLIVENKTRDEDEEAKKIEVNLSYPLRNFTAFLEYNLTNNNFISETSLRWENKTRNLEAAVKWERNKDGHPKRHTFELELRHPSLEKNVSIVGDFRSSSRKLLEVDIAATYSLDDSHDLKFNHLLERNLDPKIINYTYKIWSNHPATNLHLNAKGDLLWKTRWYHTSHFATYERTYLPLQTAETFATIDWDGKEIELKRKTLRELLYFWGKYEGGFPVYTANLTALHGEDVNSNGTFYLDLREKVIDVVLNLTEDGSQCLRGYGYIPDARSAVFDIWREYEDISVSDVAYYLRLNHSRLIVSSLQWRPELKQDIKNVIKAAALAAYTETIESTDYWRHFIRAEVADSIADICENAKPFVEGLLADLVELKVVEDDFKKLQTYMNKSYYANEFYIRDVVRFAVYAVDELSIRSHLESLPAFVSEIWEIMGESGKKIQKGIQWVIERTKYYYKSTADFFNGILQGDSAQHLSDALKKLVEKYDNFIKDMHVTFIRYMENLWNKTYSILLDNWHKTLAAIEPTFIQIIHYLETMVWNASKEFLDFLYLRKNELINSLYFSKFTHFTQDLDKFYRDMTGNETIWKIIEYSKVGYNFIREKYFELVPFSKELQNVTREIVDEVNELNKLPSIKMLLTKVNDLSNQIKWFWDYFDVDNKIRVFITQLHIKLTDIRQTALQAESKYREAKTLFVFEPKDGVMYYEQKLPISWHAFNEPPKFQEIPEYKMLYEIRQYFMASRITFWSFYYNLQQYTDPANWLPPFKAQAMLAGRNPFFITFDRVFYNYTSLCSHLLVSDFLDRNLSLVISYKDDINITDPYEIMVILNKSIIHINIFTKVIRFENDNSPLTPIRLPFQVEHTVVYYESDIIIVERDADFSLRCNTKFFTCILEMSGWYFGRTAGLWGTINNEPSDDLISSHGQRMKLINASEAAQSWSLNKKCLSHGKDVKISYDIPEPSASEEIESLCEVLFTSKVSPFSPCFSRVSIEPFWNICLKSKSEQDACTVAIAYMNLCAIENTPLREPEICVKCELQNGTNVKEGDFITFHQKSTNLSVDLVFIVEVKECNKNIRNNRKIDVLVELIDKELKEKNITNNRYALVLYGGNQIYEKPRVVFSNGNVFTNAKMIVNYFNEIPQEKGVTDTFEALAFSTKLLFRPGVSKTFILIPCSDYLDYSLKFDYGLMNQLLLENDITLHILMDDEFQLRKSRYNTSIFGIDRTLSYTEKGAKKFNGDADLRKKIKMPKATLGICMPLALETNGSIFSAKKLEANQTQISKRFARVFAKRVAQSGHPAKCQICECSATNTGVSYMECFPCDIPTYPTVNKDNGSNELESSTLGGGLYSPEEK